jgi:hypothetical protein
MYTRASKILHVMLVVVHVHVHFQLNDGGGDRIVVIEWWGFSQRGVTMLPCAG